MSLPTVPRILLDGSCGLGSCRFRGVVGLALVWRGVTASAGRVWLTGLALAMDIIYSRTEDRRIRKHLGQEPPLSVHALPPELSVAPTVFIRRKGPASPKVSALVEVLMEQSDLKSQPIRRRKSAA